MKDEIREKEVNAADRDHKITKRESKKITKDVIHEYCEELEKSENLPHLPKDYPSKISERFDKYFEEVISDTFRDLPVLAKSKKELKSICVNLSCKGGYFSPYWTGVVIAGFGDDDVFPTLNSYITGLVINKRLKYKKQESIKIFHDIRAGIDVFGRNRDVLTTFLKGITPGCQKKILICAKDLLDKIPDSIEGVKFTPPEGKEIILEKLNNTNEQILEDFKREINKYIQENNIDPILDAVALLPKEELASMAESLVNLTSFKKKISVKKTQPDDDYETVGGPIDVAVISKGDGFVWIKRKHYFSSELNPHYMSNYLYSETTCAGE